METRKGLLPLAITSGLLALWIAYLLWVCFRISPPF